MRRTYRPYRFSKPPKVLRRPGVKLDNIAIVPASLLPYKEEWQSVANQLPRGSVLLCSQASNGRQMRILQKVAAHLKAHGHTVATVPGERFAL